MVRILGDGNCQPRALAHQLYGDDAKHKEVREAAFKALVAKPETFLPYMEFDEDEDVVQYMERIGNDREYGDLALLIAAGMAFKRDIVVVLDTGVEVYRTPSGNENTPLWVRHHFPTPHYDSIQLIGGDSCLPSDIPLHLANALHAQIRGSADPCLPGSDVLVLNNLPSSRSVTFSSSGASSRVPGFGASSDSDLTDLDASDSDMIEWSSATTCLTELDSSSTDPSDSELTDFDSGGASECLFSSDSDSYTESDWESYAESDWDAYTLDSDLDISAPRVSRATKKVSAEVPCPSRPFPSRRVPTQPFLSSGSPPPPEEVYTRPDLQLPPYCPEQYPGWWSHDFFTRLSGNQQASLRKQYDAIMAKVEGDATTSEPWRRVFAGEAVFTSRQDSRNELFNAFITYGNPRLLQILLDILSGQPLPTTTQQAAIGWITMEDRSLSYIRLIARMVGPNEAYSGHTRQVKPRVQAHKRWWAAHKADRLEKLMALGILSEEEARLAKAAGELPQDAGDMRFACSSLFPVPRNLAEQDHYEFLSHFMEGLIFAWLATGKGVVREHFAPFTISASNPSYVGNNMRSPFFERCILVSPNVALPRSTTDSTANGEVVNRSALLPVDRIARNREYLRARYAADPAYWKALNRKGFNKRSPEKKEADKRKRRERQQAMLASETPEERRARCARNRAWYAALTPEEKTIFLTMQSVSPQARKTRKKMALVAADAARWATLTREERLALTAKEKARKVAIQAARTAKEKIIRDAHAAKKASRTPEEKAALAAKDKARKEARRASETPAEKRARMDRNNEAKKRYRERQSAARKAKLERKAARAAKRLRKAMKRKEKEGDPPTSFVPICPTTASAAPTSLAPSAPVADGSVGAPTATPTPVAFASTSPAETATLEPVVTAVLSPAARLDAPSAMPSPSPLQTASPAMPAPPAPAMPVPPAPEVPVPPGPAIPAPSRRRKATSVSQSGDSAEPRRARSTRDPYASETPEARRARLDRKNAARRAKNAADKKAKEGRALDSDEEAIERARKDKHAKKQRDRLARESPEAKRARLDRKNEGRRAKHAQEERERLARESPETKRARLDRKNEARRLKHARERESLACETPEEKRARLDRQKKAARLRHAQEERERRARETPEEKRARLDRKNAARRVKSAAARAAPTDVSSSDTDSDSDSGAATGVTDSPSTKRRRTV